MMNRFLAVFLALVGGLGSAAAQTSQRPTDPRGTPPEPAPHQQRFDPLTGRKILPLLLYQNETPEERKQRLGTQEDPGPDPDPNQKWIRFGKTYTIERYRRKDAAYDQRYGWVRPMWPVNVAKEIYQENEQYVWVWIEERPRAEPPPPAVAEDQTAAMQMTYEGQGLQFVLQVKDEFQTVDPPPANVTVRFRESSSGLPDQGSWRNGLDVADMNGDGKPDLVVPPPRGGGGSMRPVIFLGDGTGRWQQWKEARWPVGLNYGTAAAGDLNSDGHQDIVYGVHLHGIIAVLGDGKGTFVNASNGLPDDFPTRRVLLSDVDRDGDLDIIAISEGAVFGPKKITGSRLRVYLNEDRAKQWKLLRVADPRRSVAGDWLTVGNFNGDKYPDIAGASIIFHGTDLIYLSEGKGQWKPFGRGWLPFYSYYGAVAAGKLTSKKRDDLVMAFLRYWPDNVDPAQVPPPSFKSVVGIERISFEREGPRRTPIVRWEGNRAVWGMAIADFDGDRNEDIIYWDSTRRENVLLLGDGRGTFRKAQLEGMEIPRNTLYDIKAEDVNGDGRRDVILMFESQTGEQNGSIRVWLNESGKPREKRVARR